MDPGQVDDSTFGGISSIEGFGYAGGPGGDITGFMGHSIGPLETTELSDRIKDRSAPDWASGM
jgi:hypothetical protein